MKLKFISVLLTVLLSLSSCFPKMHRTTSNGVRFENPSTYWLKYKRQKFDNGQRKKIDANSIYETTIKLQDNSHYKMIARFFPTGQVLFFVENHPPIPFENQVNDSLAGIPGYYAVDGQKLKFQKWTNIFGDQTPDIYGIIVNDSTLKIYTTYVPDCRRLFDGMTTYECLEKNQKFTLWIKTNKYELKKYTPNW